MATINRSILGTILVLTGLVTISNAQETQSPQQNDAKIVDKIRGDYVLRGGSTRGTKLTAERIANVSVKITDRTITTYDGQLAERFSASYQVQNDKQPFQVLLKSVKKIIADGEKNKEKVEQSDGIIDISEDGQRLKLAYALDGSERPRDFKGNKLQNVFELERLPTK